MDSSFYGHLASAIGVNWARCRIYSKMSGGRSLLLSWQLIALEILSLPIAKVMDWMAAPFQRRGIFVVAADFAPMDPLPPPEQLPRYTGKATPEVLQKVKRLTAVYRSAIALHNRRGEFATAVEASLAALHQVKAIEREHHCHFAMTIHLIESIAFAAMHAGGYAKESGGATIPLSKKLIWLQNQALRFALFLDRQAQKLHQLGVGILVNDMPHIL